MILYPGGTRTALSQSLAGSETREAVCPAAHLHLEHSEADSLFLASSPQPYLKRLLDPKFTRTVQIFAGSRLGRQNVCCTNMRTWAGSLRTNFQNSRLRCTNWNARTQEAETEQSLGGSLATQPHQISELHTQTGTLSQNQQIKTDWGRQLTSTSGLYTDISICTYTPERTHLCIHTHTHLHTHACTHIYIYTPVHTHTCTSTHPHTPVYTYIYIPVHTHLYKHTTPVHTHIHTSTHTYISVHTHLSEMTEYTI